MPRSAAPRSKVAVADAPRARYRLLLALGLVIGTLTWVAAAGAQDVTSVAAAASVDIGVERTPTPEATSELRGPTMPAASVRYVPQSTQLEPANRSAVAADERVQDQNPGLRRNLALIGVGVAAMIIGSEVDDGAGSLIVLTGAGLSLYGLYLILR